MTTIVLDGGDSLFKETLPSLNQLDREKNKAKAELIAGALPAMGTLAQNVGRQDLADGLKFLRETATKKRLNLISANLFDLTGQRLFQPDRRLQWGDRKVVVLGVTMLDPGRDQSLGIKVGNPVEALKSSLATVGPDDILIVLSDLGYQEEHDLARQVPRINLIIGGGNGARSLGSPVPIGQTLLLRASDRGRELGVLDLSFEDKPWGTPVNLAREGGGTTSAGNERGVGYLNRLLVLDPNVPDNPDFAKLVNDFQAEWATRAPPPSNPEPGKVAGQAVSGAPPGFSSGTISCKGCHEAAFKKWKSTGHLTASSKLPRDKRRGAECMKCHATKLTFQTHEGLEPLVGCEACHGKGSGHPGDGKVTRRVDQEVCRGCHRGEHDNKPFNFEEAYKLIRCDGR